MKRRESLVTLVLLLGACQPFTGGVGGTRGEGTGSGDGDGDVTGDGDGDASGDGDGDASGDGDGDTSGDGDGDTSGDGDGDMTTTGDGDGDTLCGNGVVDVGEECDDADPENGDGCDSDCSYTTVVVRAGGSHTCVLIEGGRVRCWGAGATGALGYGNTEDIGDDETPASVGDVVLPAPVVDLEVGNQHTCALFNDERVRCWGSGADGRLGQGDTDDLGDDETLGTLASIDLGMTPSALASGGSHNCVILSGGNIRCFGLNGDGQLGIASTESIGDDEPPADAAAVAVGGEPFVEFASGNAHNCALNAIDELYCWGKNQHGQLGYGNNQDLGDNESLNISDPVAVFPEDLPDGETIEQIALGKDNSCVLFTTGEVLCWGRGSRGQLGQADTVEWGNNLGEDPGLLDPIELGDSAVDISAGSEFHCAVLANGDVRCWGKNDLGQLGIGSKEQIGDDELPTAVDPVELPGSAIQISSGDAHTCAVLDDYSVVCWGRNTDGRLGYGNTDDVGAEQTPLAAGTVDLL